MTRSIAPLEKQLADHEPEFRRGGQNSKRSDIRCYGCGKLGYIKRNAKGDISKEMIPKQVLDLNM